MYFLVEVLCKVFKLGFSFIFCGYDVGVWMVCFVVGYVGSIVYVYLGV